MPEALRDWMDRISLFDAGWTVGLLLFAVVVGWLVHATMFAALRRWAEHTTTTLDNLVAEQLRRPARYVVPLLAVVLVLPLLPVSDGVRAGLRQAHALALTAAITWLLIGVVRVTESYLLRQYDIGAEDNLHARAVHTQVRVFRNVVVFLVLVLGTGVALMTFPAVRRLGVSLLASAGAAGVIIGFAAQRSIATLVAGIQIAITQPVRLGDVVIVENEWGQIEEITLTYVVVKIWDKRRLVLPITYFIEKPFQNWTRTEANLLGTVFVYADYRVPVEELRQAFKRILDESGRWDGETWGLIVVDASERCLHARALLSAPDSGTAWELRCHVREKLLDWLAREHPHALPQTRVELDERRAA